MPSTTSSKPRSRATRARKRIAVAALAISALVLVLNGCPEPSPPACPDCNVVLITVDTLRPDRLGVYGYDRATSPFLDAFAKSATVFDAASSPAPCTLPAVEQVLTGTLRHGARDERLAESLSSHGYTSGAIVSHHFFRDAAGPRDSFRRGYETFDIQPQSAADQHGMTTRSATEVSDLALDWLGSRPPDEKFFLWLHYFDPHDPYLPPEEHRLFAPPGSQETSGDSRSTLMAAGGPDDPWMVAGDVFSPGEVAYLNALYDAEIHYTDHEIGRVLGALRTLDLRERSIVIITSDHGERLGERNTWDHCLSLHRWELRVPLLVSVAGRRLESTERSVDPVSTIDIVPTILGLLGIEHQPDRYDGADLRHRDPARRIVTAWHTERAVRDREWKLHYPSKGPLRLYRSDRDVGEDDDLASTETVVRDQLIEVVEARSAIDAPTQRKTTEIVKRLKALGYIE